MSRPSHAPCPPRLAWVLCLTFAGALGAGCDTTAPHDQADAGTLGLPCPHPPADTDGDHISDENEGAFETPPRDTDGDGVPDFRDPDSDNDAIADAIEGHNGNACTPPFDSDHDGVADFRDLDSDDALDSTVPDHIEAGPSTTTPVDTDGDGLYDYMDPDDDGDGILDIIEMTAQGAHAPSRERTTAPDTDGDGTPDYLDVDSDGDTILDADEGLSDIDGDLIPNYRDLDSDNDCVSDAHEAGDDQLVTPPIDTDGDGNPDFVDLDSDNDGLIDGNEDLNCNGALDACETNRVLADTDGDGESDLVEREACLAQTSVEQQSTQCACDGDNATVSPQTRGWAVFLVPFEKPPSAVQELHVTTGVTQADVLFTVDSTETMQPALTELGNDVTNVVGSILSVVPDSAFGLFVFRDLGTPQDDPTSNPPNLPSMQYAQRVETVTGEGLVELLGGAQGLTALGGGDPAQGGWSALWSLASTGPRDITVTATDTYTLDAIPSALVDAGETGGSLENAAFRPGSLPVFLTLTDAEWHDAPGSQVPGDPESGLDPYPSTDGNGDPACDPCTNVPSRRQAVTALQAIGAPVIGLAAQGADTFGDPKTRAMKLAEETGALVPPAAFGPASARPSGCAVGQCCTGLDASGDTIGEAPQGMDCPLAFTIDADTGAGLAYAASAGVIALARGLVLDVHVQATDIDPGTVAAFFARLDPDLSPAAQAQGCITTAPGPLQDNYTGAAATPSPDGIADTFPGMSGTSTICYVATPKTNSTVQPTTQPQIFRAQVQMKGVSGQSAFNLGAPGTVVFVVPPVIVNVPLQ